MSQSREYFQVAQRLLTERGLTICKAEFDRACFGSWVVSVDADPQLRVLYDGKDGWLYVQRLIAGPPYLSMWEDVWIEQQPSGSSLADAVDQLAQRRS